MYSFLCYLAMCVVWEIDDLIDDYINECVEEYTDKFMTEEVA